MESLQASCFSGYPSAEFVCRVRFQPKVEMQFASIHVVIAVHWFLHAATIVKLSSSIYEKLDRLVIVHGASLRSVIPNRESLCLGIVLHGDGCIDRVELFCEVIDVSSHHVPLD